MTKRTLEQAFMALAGNAPKAETSDNSIRTATLKKSRKSVPAKKTSPKRSSSLQQELEKTLSKQSKKTLVDWIMATANSDPKLLRQLKQEFSIEVSTHDLVADTRNAIANATDFDEREMNHNFDFDSHAYVTTAKNFKKLIKADRWDELLPLTLELMEKGSYQMEMSDEGMMLDDIDDCLESVIESMYDSHLPVAARIKWCEAMLKTDRTKCISTRPLKALLAALREIS